jgi:RNA polymerase sigma factor (TIGR02999 family)
MLPLVYHELRRLGRTLLREERSGHTLQPTAVVNEAYLRLAGVDLKIHDRQHCFRLIAQSMRFVLIDHGRAKARAKRELPSPEELDTLVRDSFNPSRTPIDAIDAVNAINKLAEKHEQAAEMVQLRYFFGVEDPELAELFKTSVTSVERTMRFAKAWLANYVKSSSEPGPAPKEPEHDYAAASPGI